MESVFLFLLGFLALFGKLLFAFFGKLLFAFFGVNENVIRVAQFFVTRVPDLAIAVPVIKLKLMQVFKKILIDFSLQLLCETGEQLCRFRFEWACSLKP